MRNAGNALDEQAVDDDFTTEDRLGDFAVVPVFCVFNDIEEVLPEEICLRSLCIVLVKGGERSKLTCLVAPLQIEILQTALFRAVIPRAWLWSRSSSWYGLKVSIRSIRRSVGLSTLHHVKFKINAIDRMDVADRDRTH